LGHINRDLAEHGAIDNWLLVDDAHFASLNLAALKVGVTRVSCDVQEKVVRRWLKSVDWVIWAESSPLKFFPELARNFNKRVACIPMWEWTSPTDAWLRCVDLLICPTRHAYHMFIEWRRRFGFEWRVAYFPWPVSTPRFRFHRREKCRRFVFINGHGGARARSFDTDRQLGPRKGCDVVLAAASLTPEIPWRVYTQVDLATTITPNVEVLEGPGDHAGLYAEGDVCVQPSRWEGLGLPLLECQAAGMPLVTVDAAPMNEYRPLRCVAPSNWEWGYVRWGQPMRIPVVSPESLAKIVHQLHGSDVGAASEDAHGWIGRERSWEFAVQRWRKLFEADV
jgi:glycosyltransferase involved in cell wall biosynthesis